MSDLTTAEMLGAFRRDLIDAGIEREMIGPLLVEALRATLITDDLITDGWPSEHPAPLFIDDEWCGCDKFGGQAHPYRAGLGVHEGRSCPNVRVSALAAASRELLDEVRPETHDRSLR